MKKQQKSSNVAKARGSASELWGRLAEDDVANLLEHQGYDILARRFKTGAGEIDLVAADAQRLLFVEVKARPSFAAAFYAVSARQQVRLLQAADIALAIRQDWIRSEIRFDVALVTPDGVAMVEDALRLQ